MLGLFDVINLVSKKGNLPSEIKIDKKVNIYMLNRFLSSDPDYANVINSVQDLYKTVSLEEWIMILYKILPKKFIRFTFPKLPKATSIKVRKKEEELFSYYVSIGYNKKRAKEAVFILR